MSWANPEWFLALMIIPVGIGFQYWHHVRKRLPQVTYSGISHLEQLRGNRGPYIPYLIWALQWIAIAFVILALARPQFENERIERTVEGRDIVLVIDISSSMLAEDLEPNRLIAVRNVADEFIQNRPEDRIGLVIFARESFTVSPPTLDHQLLRRQLADIDLGMVRDGTAIGMGLATAVNRLRNSDADSRVILLLTDGENNAGEIDPITAGELARAHGITVHTIGASVDDEYAPYPVSDGVYGDRYYDIPVEIDEEMMTFIAERTGGQYFRATDNMELQQVYDAIDELETTVIDEQVYTDYRDVYTRFLIPGLIILLIGLTAERWWFRLQ